ncbi:hypothetical protein CRG98_029793 [Punica granatum]|uniref:Uncharacterized protein n=1 Tax=Punica granatum TaxID=22663 RepID=A0A2I0J2A3_PUNGR|nr:hypothetical protein CRG98_029793 [Punica granatum]
MHEFFLNHFQAERLVSRLLRVPHDPNRLKGLVDTGYRLSTDTVHTASSAPTINHGSNAPVRTRMWSLVRARMHAFGSRGLGVSTFLRMRDGHA